MDNATPTVPTAPDQQIRVSGAELRKHAKYKCGTCSGQGVYRIAHAVVTEWAPGHKQSVPGEFEDKFCHCALKRFAKAFRAKQVQP